MANLRHTYADQPHWHDLDARRDVHEGSGASFWACSTGDRVTAQRRIFVPNRVFVLATEGDDLAAQSRLVPLLEGKRARSGNATAYVCRGRTCDLPTSDPKIFAAQLARVEPLLLAPSPQ